MLKCKVCGFRLADGMKKCPMCGAMPGSTKAGELLNAAHLPKYLCPSCKHEIIGEHRYCPSCGKELCEAAKKADEQNPHETKCVQCGASLPLEARFCHKCGAKQERNCSQCGAILLPNAEFCNECGAKQNSLPNARPTKDNATNASGGKEETPLEAFEYEVRNGKYILKGVKDNSLTDVVIPRVFSEIGEKVYKDEKWIGVFSACKKLKSVTVPNSVTKIGKFAFCDCHSLKSITIPDSVTQIGADVFCDCYNLTSIEIPNSVTKIGYAAFFKCRSLTSIIIPNSVTEIGDFAFCYCHSLKSITIPNSVTQIGFGAFEGCNSLKNMSIERPTPGKKYYINIKRMFGDSSSFTEVKIGNKAVHLD